MKHAYINLLAKLAAEFEITFIKPVRLFAYWVLFQCGIRYHRDYLHRATFPTDIATYGKHRWLVSMLLATLLLQLPTFLFQLR